MIKNYETVFILTPVLSDDQMKDTVKKITKLLKDNKAKIINEEMWGLRKLSYPIEHKSTGFYNLIEFDAEPQVVDKLETEFRREEKVMRFLTISLDKHALAYNDKRRKGEFNKQKKEKEKEKEEAPAS